MSAKKSGTELAPAAQERETALASMSEPLREIAAQILEKLAHVRDLAVISFYEIGQLVAEAVGDRGKYGEGAMEALSAIIPSAHNPNMLRYARVFVKVFSVEEVKEATAAAEANGFVITQSHWVALSQYAGKREKSTRAAVLKMIINKGINVRETELELKRRDGRLNKQPTGAGRKFALPKTPMAGLHQLSRYHKDMTGRVTPMKKGVFDLIAKMPLDEVTEDLIQQLETTKSDLLGAAGLAEKFAKACDEVLAKVREKQSGKKTVTEPSGKMSRPSKKKTSKKTTSAGKKAATAKKKAAAKKRKPARA